MNASETRIRIDETRAPRPGCRGDGVNARAEQDNHPTHGGPPRGNPPPQGGTRTRRATRPKSVFAVDKPRCCKCRRFTSPYDRAEDSGSCMKPGPGRCQRCLDRALCEGGPDHE